MSRRKCKFSEELQAKYPMFKKGKIDYEVIFESCNIVVSIGNKGKADLDQHLATIKHKNKIQNAENSQKINTFFVTHHTPLDAQILVAEATHAFHTVKHHQNYRSTDCTIKLYKCTFPDSQIANKISSARTKTQAIIDNVLAPNSLKKNNRIIR